jgi:hypothetical protein
MDQFDWRRFVSLKEELASLQRENVSYQLKAHHSKSEIHINELRRLRLLQIREELLKLTERQQRIQ